MSDWKTNLMFGQLPDEATYDGIIHVQKISFWYQPPELRMETYPATKFRIVCPVDNGIIVRLSPARQLNYGSGHTYSSHYGILRDGKIYRAWPQTSSCNEKDYECGFADYACYDFGVKFAAEQTMEAATVNQKICGECSRAYSCTSAGVLCLDCLIK